MTDIDITSILIGIPIALITGAYVNIVNSRYQKFSTLRIKTLNIIRSIDFMQESHGLDIKNDADLRKLTLISSELYSLGHEQAGNTVNEVRQHIEEISMHSKAGRLDAELFYINFATWQNTIRTMLPNKVALYRVINFGQEV